MNEFDTVMTYIMNECIITYLIYAFSGFITYLMNDWKKWKKFTIRSLKIA
uniref:Uncharacterized protein n=1 Tax=Picea glauca TaxID=3330 RepID=A0A101LVB4_PICGL|nr:hypothetical protein ABT39_MTgene2094 [Picea glauca]